MRTISVEKLRDAATEGEVVGLVRDFIGEWLPEEIGRLPAECRPGKLRDGEDLSLLAVNLARSCVSFDVDPEDLHVVDEMDAFVGHACRRIAEIQRRIPVAGANTLASHR